MGDRDLCCAPPTDLRRTIQTNCPRVREGPWTSAGVDLLRFVALVAHPSARNRFSDLSSGMSD